jgi:hypothetical protein
MATELLINIVSQATGKGFLESEKAVNKLEKKVKSLGKTLGISLAAGAALKFSKIFVKAFAEDEKAAVQLTKAVDNLGLSFANPSITKFIEGLERTAGISRTELRPAFQDLLTTTGSLTKAQDILNKAIIISRGSGLALSTVTEDLTKAYLGSTKGLEKYKTGFTGAELAAKSFSENLEILLTLNQGAANDYFTTTAFKLELLALAGENAKITIGEGLVEGLGNFAGSGEVSDAQLVIDDLATGFANVLKTAGAALGFLARIPEFGFRAIGLGAMYDRPETVTNKETEFTKKQKEIIAKLDAAAAKRAKALADLAKKQANAEILKRKEKEKQAKLDKAALALGKGEDVFDLDQIQIAAAILATQENIQRLGVNATDQQKLQLANDAQRLTVKQLMLDLEDAIAAKDVERATSLSKQLNTELAILGTLTGQTYKLGEIDKILDSFKPKNLINLDNLDAAIRKLNEIMGSKFDFLSPIMPSQDRTGINDLAPDITSRYVAGDPEAIRAVEAHADAISMLAESELALADALFAESIRALDLATASVSPSALPSFGGFDPARFRMADNITINVNAGVVGSEDTISLAVQRAILDLERKGDPLRYTGGL